MAHWSHSVTVVIQLHTVTVVLQSHIVKHKVDYSVSALKDRRRKR